MSIHMDLVIGTPDESVDMKTGLETMSGVSDSVRYISETILSEKSPQKTNHKRKVRTQLKKTFKGSYGHIFSIEVYDDELNKRLKVVGRAVFMELIAFFFSEALYKESDKLSPKASAIVEKLGVEAENLIKHLRKSALRNLHEVPKKFGYPVNIRFRKNRYEQRVVGQFNRSTADAVEAKKSDEEYWVRAGITRFNINTGNGRLVVEGKEETTAFGFLSPYKLLTVKAKKFISENLDYNNGLNNDSWRCVEIRVVPVKIKDGTVVKYLINGFRSDE